MPRREEGVADKNGFVFHGPVLTGKMGVREAIQQDAIRTSQAQSLGLSNLSFRERVLAYFYKNGWR